MTSPTTARKTAAKPARKPATRRPRKVPEEPLYEAVKAALGVDPVAVGSRPRWNYDEALRRLCSVA